MGLMVVGLRVGWFLVTVVVVAVVASLFVVKFFITRSVGLPTPSLARFPMVIFFVMVIMWLFPATPWSYSTSICVVLRS